MKKIVYLLSAIAAGFSSSALADISVSGTGHFGYVSGDSDQRVAGSGSVAFALSTTTANGTTISSSGGITSDLEGTAASGVSGMSSLTLLLVELQSFLVTTLLFHKMVVLVVLLLT